MVIDENPDRLGFVEIVPVRQVLDKAQLIFRAIATFPLLPR
jgi:hypothetical protein